MNKTSKRDIYDLIAELAKSSDMDIDGTEFVPTNVDVRRKPSIHDINLVTNTSSEPSPLVKPSSSEQNPMVQSVKQDLKVIDETTLSQSASIEELNLLKAAAIEELRRAKATMMNELNGHSNGKTQQPINGAEKQNTVAETTNSLMVEVKPEISQLKSSQETNESNVEKKSETIIENKQDVFESLDIDELNRVTTEAVKPKLVDSEIHHANLLANQAIEAQLKTISEKLEILGQTNLKSNIVHEIKASNEQLVQEVQQSRINFMNELSSKLNTIKPISVDSFIRWIGIVNLMLLLVVLIYLLFQKGTKTTTSSSIQNKELEPQVQHDSNALNTDVKNAQPSTVTQIENESSSKNAGSDFIEEPKSIEESRPLNPKSNLASISKSSKRNFSTNETSATQRVKSVSSNQNTIQTQQPIAIQQSNTKNATAINVVQPKNNITTTKSSVDNIKKTSSSQDVYFGED